MDGDLVGESVEKVYKKMKIELSPKAQKTAKEMESELKKW
jgi:hypothetical protein